MPATRGLFWLEEGVDAMMTNIASDLLGSKVLESMVSQSAIAGQPSYGIVYGINPFDTGART